MEQKNNFYKVDHRYNKNSTPMINTNDQQSVKSYREQIEVMLARWHQLQKQKQQCQPIDFDQIMETDLTQQLHELEQQEQKQYNLLEQALELQLSQDNHLDKIDVNNTRQELQQLEILKQYEKNEQQHEYDIVLQKLKQYEQFEKLQLNQQFKLKNNNTKQFVYIHQQKHILKLQLTIIKENQTKTRKIIHLLESYTNKKKIYVVQQSKQTKTK